MSRRTHFAIAALAALALAAGACASEDDDGASGGSDSGGDAELVACQVTDEGGINDKSFNQTANEGLVRAEEDGIAQAEVLESRTEADIETNISAFLEQDCDLIVPVGFKAGDATAAAAEANPDQKFAIVDYDFFDVDAGEDISFDNVSELTFATDEAAFLAGYAAAGVSTTGKVATYGGLDIPTVTIFMTGYKAGVDKYNEDNGTDVQVLGMDSFIGNFTDQDKGKTTTQSFIDEGADVIMPVAGPVGLGTIAAVEESGQDIAVIWVDVDGCVSLPDKCQHFLTSVEKKMDNAVFDSIKAVADGNFTGGVYVGTLENEGVGIADFQQWDDRVPQEVKDKVAEYRQAIIDGNMTVS